jgi:hypothetical protein
MKIDKKTSFIVVEDIPDDDDADDVPNEIEDAKNEIINIDEPDELKNAVIIPNYEKKKKENIKINCEICGKWIDKNRYELSHGLDKCKKFTKMIEQTRAIPIRRKYENLKIF